jgi:hypothetical protein
MSAWPQGERDGQLTITKVLVHTPDRGSLGTLHTLSYECLCISCHPASEDFIAYHLQSLIGDLLDLDVHGSFLSLIISTARLIHEDIRA